jgi:hypothetical protein
MNIRKTRKMIKRNKMITFFLMRKGLIFLTKLKISGLTTKKVMIFFLKLWMMPYTLKINGR